MAAKYFYYQLRAPQGEKAMEYLKGKEGAFPSQTMRRFGLGYARDSCGDELYRYLKKKGISEELMKESGTDQRK